VVHGGAALPRAGQVESSTLMVASGHGAVAPLDRGTRALEPRRQPLGRVMERVLGLGAPRTQGATGLTPRGAPVLGAFPKRRASADGPRLGHPIASERWDERGGQGAGGGLCHIALRDLWPHLTRAARAGRRHGRHDARGVLAALPAALAAPCVVGQSPSRRAMPEALCRQALAVSTSTALTSAPMSGLADGAQAL